MIELKSFIVLYDGKFIRAYEESEVDNVITELEENHKKEVEQLRMKISGLEKLVETADKLIKQKGGFTVKDVTFGGVKLEGIKTQRMKHD